MLGVQSVTAARLVSSEESYIALPLLRELFVRPLRDYYFICHPPLARPMIGGKTKPGGIQIGKHLAEKSKGLFSAEDWQCATCGNVNWARYETLPIMSLWAHCGPVCQF